MSYLRNKYLFTKKIYLVINKENKQVYRNISYLYNFTYLDFKLWIINTLNKGYNTKETKLDFLDNEVNYYFRVEVDNIDYLIGGKQPKSINPKDFIKEILHDYETDTIEKIVNNLIK